MFELKSVAPRSRKTVQVFSGSDDEVVVRAREGDQSGYLSVLVGVSKTELREGLAREFGWTIYESADLPEVTVAVGGKSLIVGGEYYDPAPEYSKARRELIRQYLAVEDYISVHPPVKDPADDIAAIIHAASRADEGSISAMGAKVIANALLNSGKVVAK